MLDLSTLSLLAPCTQIWGRAEVLEGDLAVETHEDSVYLPVSDRNFYFADPNWGIYGPSGELIEAAALRHGADQSLVGQSPLKTFDGNIEEAPPAQYVYGGIFNGHYGHFICSSLARLWYFCDVDVGDVKVVFHSHQSAAEMFELPFVRFCFKKIGLSERNIVVFREPTRIKNLIVPLPAFSEQNFVHARYRQICHKIGRDFIDDEAAAPMNPVYLSKTGLNVGVGRLVDERIIEDILIDHGVQIVHPERLNFPDQVKLFSQPRIFLGTIGSAFHTAIFAPPRGKMIGFSGFNSVSSNAILIDKINQNDSLYLYTRVGASMSSDSENFQGETIIEDIDVVGRELASIVVSCIGF